METAHIFSRPALLNDFLRLVQHLFPFPFLFISWLTTFASLVFVLAVSLLYITGDFCPLTIGGAVDQQQRLFPQSLDVLQHTGKLGDTPGDASYD